MTRISKTFDRLKINGKKAFIAYICGGDPTIVDTKELVFALQNSGVDIMELGVPFSDPLADGVVNQRASERALKNNVSLNDILTLVREIRQKSEIPIVLFTYINPILRFGIPAFAKRAAECGVDGVLALDYPPEEWGNYRKIMSKADIDIITLIAPTSSDERIRLITKSSTGFIYYVSRTGVTGERSAVQKSVEPMVNKIKSYTNVPVAVGFGISTPEQVRQLAQFADGIVVGSAIVKRIEESGKSTDLIRKVSEFTLELTAPLRKQSE